MGSCSSVDWYDTHQGSRTYNDDGLLSSLGSSYSSTREDGGSAKIGIPTDKESERGPSSLFCIYVLYMWMAGPATGSRVGGREATPRRCDDKKIRSVPGNKSAEDSEKNRGGPGLWRGKSASGLPNIENAGARHIKRRCIVGRIESADEIFPSP